MFDKLEAETIRLGEQHDNKGSTLLKNN